MSMFVMSVFLWHVQIITRVGTCMPLVYWYVAERIFTDVPEDEGVAENQWSFKGIIKRAREDFRRHEGLWEVRYMVTWIGVQAVLYASFIPPA
jgi:phosphatidylinositol glycan class V